LLRAYFKNIIATNSRPEGRSILFLPFSNQRTMKDQEVKFNKSTAYAFDQVCNYSPGSSSLQTILKKTTGTLNALALDTRQFIDSKFSPFDIYIHVIEGRLETIIDGTSIFVNSGEFLIVPGHTRNTSQALLPTKLLHLTIKSGYEQVL
jgi:quercetin dioxygenase-like cupin family protein